MTQVEGQNDSARGGAFWKRGKVTGNRLAYVYSLSHHQVSCCDIVMSHDVTP